ncbi:MAG: hypothetical protein CM15mP77_1690 [Synechococcus sp.]|nr:MAG: hypothetical protein CM15mP77_1690 [Synechococcus sp.]
MVIGLSVQCRGWLALFFDHLVAAAMALVLLEGLSGMAGTVAGAPALGLGDPAGGSRWCLARCCRHCSRHGSGHVERSLGREPGSGRRLQPRQAFAFGPFIAWGSGWSGSGCRLVVGAWQQLLGF